MTNLLKDFYVMAYQACKKISPKGGATEIASFATNMCAIMLLSFLSLGLDIGLKLFGLSFHKVLGNTRVVWDAAAILVAILCALSMGPIIRRIPELQSPETIKERYDGLSRSRVIFALVLFVGAPIAFIVL